MDITKRLVWETEGRRGAAELDSAIRVIENVTGFDDETTRVGEAWAIVLRYLRLPNASLERAAAADTLEDNVRCENCGGSGAISFNPNLNPNSFPGTATAKCTQCRCRD